MTFHELLIFLYYPLIGLAFLIGLALIFGIIVLILESKKKKKLAKRIEKIRDWILENISF